MFLISNFKNQEDFKGNVYLPGDGHLFAHLQRQEKRQRDGRHVGQRRHLQDVSQTHDHLE